MLRNPRDPSRDIYLDWHGAVGDEGHLRRCPVCGCQEFFVSHRFPTVTFMVLLIVTAVAAGLLFADKLWSTVAFLAMAGSLTAIVMTLTPRQLNCYQCLTVFGKVPIARHQKAWETAIGERHRPWQAPPGSPSSQDAPGHRPATADTTGEASDLPDDRSRP